MTLNAVAQQAFRSEKLIRLPFGGGDISLVRIAPTAFEAGDDEAVGRLVDKVWESKKGGSFDGRLLGIFGLSFEGLEASLLGTTIRYRDYVAADKVIEQYPDRSFPLAIGIHALLLSRGNLVCLRLDDGRTSLPGGAVDGDDLLHHAQDALLGAVRREVFEETGIRLEGQRLDVTGLYVGGYPTHIIAMVAADLGDVDVEASLAGFAPVDSYDRVRRVELIALSQVLEQLEEMPLIFRSAVKSYLHWRGEGAFETIDQ